MADQFLKMLSTLQALSSIIFPAMFDFSLQIFSLNNPSNYIIRFPAFCSD